MIDNHMNLSIEDKMYLICHPENFSLSVRTSIYFNDTWKHMIKDTVPINQWQEEERTVERIFNEFIDLAHKYENNDGLVYKMTVEFMNDVLRNVQSDSIDGIKDVIFSFSNFHKKLTSLAISPDSRFIREIFYLFYDRVLRFKVKAYEIVKKTYKINSNDFDNNPNLSIFMDQQFECMIDEFLSIRENGYSQTNEFLAMIIYLFVLYLTDTTDNSMISKEQEKLVDIFSTSSYFLFSDAPFNYKVVNEFVNSLLLNKVDGIDFIDSLKNEEKYSTNRTDDILNLATKYAIKNKNYSKNMIDKIYKNGAIVTGDFSLLDGMTHEEFLIEITKLITDRIYVYVHLSGGIKFNISPRNIGFVKVHEKLNVCKLLVPNSGFYTIISKDDRNYLLFENSNETNKLYGISFPSEDADERKIIIFDIPDGLDYKLLTNSEEDVTNEQI